MKFDWHPYTFVPQDSRDEVTNMVTDATDDHPEFSVFYSPQLKCYCWTVYFWEHGFVRAPMHSGYATQDAAMSAAEAWHSEE